ncbi:MAG: hypothetical protein ABIH82_01310, partial [Candidatus Woesearchaeota archaeon]
QLGIPKYFIVKSDSSPEFNEYVGWLNKTYSRHWDASAISFNGWLGYDRVGNHDGTDYYHHPHEFHNNPVQFTAQEFMKIIKSKQTSDTTECSFLSYFMKKIIVSEALLAEANNSNMSPGQENFIKEHMNIFTREVSEEDVISFYNSITCPEWKSRLEKEFEFLKSSPNIMEIKENNSRFKDIYISGKWAGRLQIVEREGENHAGYTSSEHLSSIFLANCNGKWFNEVGREVEGFLYYKPGN